MKTNGNPKLEIRIPKEGRSPKSESAAARFQDSDFGFLSGFGFRISDFTIWQLIDSAFPTGGFAHSSGLEAAWQHGEVRNRAELISFVEASLDQLGHAGLPFVMAGFDAPEKLAEFDQLCDAFTTNHVANRASRAQGRAFLTAVERIFPERGVHAASMSVGGRALKRPEGRAPYAHFAPVFGACLRRLDKIGSAHV